MGNTEELLDVPVDRRQIQAFYGAAAPAYDEQTAASEARPKALALEKMARKPGERYLEVAVGTGLSAVEQVSRSGAGGFVGIDMTPGMLALTRKRLREAGASAVPLILADARHLPFAAASFDCVFNSYMLDLIPTADIPLIVAEFRRVLRPGGRIVLVNLTDGEGADASFSENWKQNYLVDPIRLGACRPVQAGRFMEPAGFTDIQRTYCGEGQSWPTEVVTARVPS